MFARFSVILVNTLSSSSCSSSFNMMRPPFVPFWPQAKQLITFPSYFSTHYHYHQPSAFFATMNTHQHIKKPMCFYFTHGKCTKMDDPAHMERFDHDSSVGVQVDSGELKHVGEMNTTGRRKPLCLYYTHGKCTKMDDPFHVEMFDHDCSLGLEVDVHALEGLQSQQFDYLLVLDLEGKVEILEFPVIMIDLKTLRFVDFFHRFVRPVKMDEQRVNEYIEGKYGKIGVDRVWHDTAITFQEVLQEFEDWMARNNLRDKKSGGSLLRAAFVTCGNWDLKTKIPQQCKDSNIKLPSYFLEWINLKDIYLNFYKREARGMRTMMDELQIPLLGTHHLGIDDSKNIVRVMQRMLSDGVVMQITARRSVSSHGTVQFLFKNRIR
ncbi:Eri1 exoribonuclease [Thalictrum thalictroides]|uniref:Eri1 exoribonuclease n=1 Tax=Thalictrum thalictroides TaxID=46969 RepID=A0A7J6WVP9_THATH|nr:Eri1 exoribonuclease [Thalictrum thalictroides]